MTIRGFLSAVAVSAALLGSAAGCGVKTGDEVAADRDATPTTATPSTTADKGSDEGTDAETTAPEDETTTTSGDSGSETTLTIPGGDFDVRGAMIDGFKSAGFTEEQATCLADEFEKMGLTTSGSSNPDVNPTDMLAVFDRCHISLEDLGKLGGAGG